MLERLVVVVVILGRGGGFGAEPAGRLSRPRRSEERRGAGGPGARTSCLRTYASYFFSSAWPTSAHALSGREAGAGRRGDGPALRVSRRSSLARTAAHGHSSGLWPPQHVAAGRDPGSGVAGRESPASAWASASTDAFARIRLVAIGDDGGDGDSAGGVVTVTSIPAGWERGSTAEIAGSEEGEADRRDAKNGKAAGANDPQQPRCVAHSCDGRACTPWPSYPGILDSDSDQRV